MAMRTIESIQVDYEETRGLPFEDGGSQDEAFRDGSLRALKYVLGLPDDQRLGEIVAAVNKAGEWVSWGDDYCDAGQFGYELSLLFCLNRIVRRYPISVEDIQRDPVGCDHEFEWHGESDERGGYVYVCEECGHRES